MLGKQEIMRAYLDGGSAEAVARRLNEKFGAGYFTAPAIQAVWSEQWRTADPLLRSLGRRPETGFSQNDDKIKLAKVFMAA